MNTTNTQDPTRAALESLSNIADWLEENAPMQQNHPEEPPDFATEFDARLNQAAHGIREAIAALQPAAIQPQASGYGPKLMPQVHGYGPQTQCTGCFGCTCPLHFTTPAATTQASEPSRPDILEKLTYHALERDDLALGDCLEYLAAGWRRVHGRTERQMVLQLTALLAGQPAAPAQASEPSVWALRFPGDKRLNLGTVFDTEAEAAEYAADRTANAVVVPLYEDAPARAVEPLTPDEIMPLAREHTWLNGSHQFCNYENFAHAAIAAFCSKNGIGIPATQAAQGGEK